MIPKIVDTENRKRTPVLTLQRKQWLAANPYTEKSVKSSTTALLLYHYRKSSTTQAPRITPSVY